MPSKTTITIAVAALAYGTAVMAAPFNYRYDLVKRDYDVAELDARTLSFDLDARDVHIYRRSPPAHEGGFHNGNHHHQDGNHYHQDGNHYHQDGNHHHPHHDGHSQHGNKAVALSATGGDLSAGNSEDLVTREPPHGDGYHHHHHHHSTHRTEEAVASPATGGDSSAGDPEASALAARDLQETASGTTATETSGATATSGTTAIETSGATATSGTEVATSNQRGKKDGNRKPKQYGVGHIRKHRKYGKHGKHGKRRFRKHLLSKHSMDGDATTTTATLGSATTTATTTTATLPVETTA